MLSFMEQGPSASWCVSHWGRVRDWVKEPSLPILHLKKWLQMNLHKLMYLAKCGAASKTMSVTSAVQVLGFL